MMKRMWGYLLFAVIVCGLAGTAMGTPVTFDFTGDNELVPSVALTVNGVTVTATPQSSEGSPQISQTSDGLGIRTIGIGGDNNQIDEVGASETLVLTFDAGPWPVTLVSVTFERVGLDDDFSLSVDGNVLVSSTDIPGGNASDGARESFDFTIFPVSFRTGNVFMFATPGSDDDYRVKSLTVNTTPEPSSLLLLGSGLSGLGWVGFLRTRQRKTRLES